MWPKTGRILSAWFAELDSAPDSPAFPNARGGHLTRDGVRYILDQAVTVATPRCPSLRGKTISPHVFRHTTAMHLLQAGVDCSVIALWLGHESLETTHIYVEADCCWAILMACASGFSIHLDGEDTAGGGALAVVVVPVDAASVTGFGRPPAEVGKSRPEIGDRRDVAASLRSRLRGRCDHAETRSQEINRPKRAGYQELGGVAAVRGGSSTWSVPGMRRCGTCPGAAVRFARPRIARAAVSWTDQPGSEASDDGLAGPAVPMPGV